ncbi:MAG TPA: hypothetical protein VG986_18040 [Pseudolabrys sp.]|nr:hypothetical protein [Pseudolabrys sp.]
MSCRSVALAALLVVASVGAASAADLPKKAPVLKKPAEAPFFIVNDNSVSYHYEFKATNPGAGATPKHVLSYTHFDVWKYGTNFINIDWLKATSGQTPSGPCGLLGQPATGCAPYTEIYGFFRSTFGFNEVFNTKAFSYGPLTDVSLMVGADLNTDNTALSSAKRSIEAGIQFSFATPYNGFINLTPTVYKEWQHDGFAVSYWPAVNPSGDVDFDTTWGFEWLYVQPLGFMPSWLPLTYKFFGTIHGPKGCGEVCNPGPGLTRTTEYYLQQNLSLDVGPWLGMRPNMYSIWGGYRYWVNKFGIDPNQPGGHFVGTKESTWLLGATVSF